MKLDKSSFETHEPKCGLIFNPLDRRVRRNCLGFVTKRP